MIHLSFPRRPDSIVIFVKFQGRKYGLGLKFLELENLTDEERRIELARIVDALFASARQKLVELNVINKVELKP